MTPISGIVRRLLGGPSTAATESTTSTRQTNATPSETRSRETRSGDGGGDGSSEGRRRRRGKRGGRGRNRGRGGGDSSNGSNGSNASNDGGSGRSGRNESGRNESNGGGSGRGTATRERGGSRDADSEDRSERGGGRRRGRRGGRNRGGNGGNGSAGGDDRGGRSQRGGSSNGRSRGDSGGRDRSSNGRSRSGSGGGSGRSGRSGDRRGSGGSSSKENYAWGGKGDREQNQQRRDRAAGRRRGFRPPRESLEAPLPEDVAFRSIDEGGAGDILPARRRRPKGIRSTERVMVGGARTLSGIPRTFGGGAKPVRAAWDDDFDDDDDDEIEELTDELDDDDLDDDELDDEELEDEVADELDDDVDEAEESEEAEPAEAPAAVVTVEADEETDEDEAEDRPQRRRRGRRGGRRERERRAAREAAIAKAEAEEDDEVPVDHDHSIGAIEELPIIVQLAIDDSSDVEIPKAFEELGLSDESLAAIARFGFTDPTPIQAQAIPELLDGNDVVGLAQTGSGKTLAFGLPMVEQIDSDSDEVQAIVLVPTRELAQQVLDVLTDLGRSYGLRTVGLLGGHALKRDFSALREQPQVVVGTPGRIIDHLRRETLSLRHVSYAVLDEADQMLDIGFLPDIRRILGRTPKRRQTALFSATMPTSIRRLIWQFMDDPVTVKVDAELSTVDTVEQIYFEVAQRDKTKGLRELIDRELKGRTLVFCKMKRGVDRLAHDLEGRGVRVGALHGDMDQRRRDRVVERFRQGELDILIATNVAARGLDIPEITHVVNFDVPQNAEEYVHRIGRTGRAGREGKAITFVGEWEFDDFQRVLDEFEDEITKQRLDLYRPDEPAASVDDDEDVADDEPVEDDDE